MIFEPKKRAYVAKSAAGKSKSERAQRFQTASPQQAADVMTAVIGKKLQKNKLRAPLFRFAGK